MESHFLGFDAAGVGEIGRMTGLNEWLVSPGDGWEERLYETLRRIDVEYVHLPAVVAEARRKAATCFSLEKYVLEVDKLISA